MSFERFLKYKLGESVHNPFLRKKLLTIIDDMIIILIKKRHFFSNMHSTKYCSYILIIVPLEVSDIHG